MGRTIFDEMDDIVSGFWMSPARGVWVDTDKYSIVPKESYRQELLTKKDKELKQLDDYYAKRKKEIEEEKQRLLARALDP